MKCAGHNGFECATRNGMKCATRQDESGWVVVNVKSAYLCGEKNELTKTEDMANNKTTMTDLRINISELAKGTSKRKISRDLHISRTSIDVYEKRAEESEYTYAELLSKTEKELSDILRR